MNAGKPREVSLQELQRLQRIACSTCQLNTHAAKARELLYKIQRGSIRVKGFVVRCSG